MIKKEKSGIKKLIHNTKCLLIKDYEAKLESSRLTRKMILESTRGSINHFYNMNGEKIRGYSNNVVYSRKVQHPLIAKYE